MSEKEQYEVNNFPHFEKHDTDEKRTILIVDDSEMNRDMLKEILAGDYIIEFATNGKEAIQKIEKGKHRDFAVVLLDLVMPEMDGFDVMEWMNGKGILDELPVIIISSDNTPKSMNEVFKLGASDYISRPFDFRIVRRRVSNIVKLYEKQRKLVDVIACQVAQAQKNKNMLNDILCHVVEFRNTESSDHIRNIKKITQVLLMAITRKTNMYNLSVADISVIIDASGLHDIGKVTIPDEIINKPGRLTNEEFAIMKTHASAGSEMIKQLVEYKDEPLIKYSYQIARWHHERYDGRGYPDGLKGDEIPIAAQIVSIADVYDALTADRVYKKAFSKEKALDMITNGECGVFNPFLLECFISAIDEIDAAKRSSEQAYDDDFAATHERIVRILKETDLTDSMNVEGVLDNIGGGGYSSWT